MRFKRHLLPALVTVGVLAFGAAALAAGNFGLDTAAGSTIPKTTDIAQLIGKILQTALGFVGTLFLLLMVYAGFIYMTARGDEKKVSEAKKMIVGAVVGVVIIASAYAITSFVLSAATGQTPASSSDSGSGSGAKKATGATCAADAECANNVCQPATCDRNGTDCTTSTDCPDASSGEVCSRRCQ